MSHLLQTSIGAIPRLNESDAKAWINTICLTLSDMISTNVEIESGLQNDLIEAKREYISNAEIEGIANTKILTPYGEGFVEDERVEKCDTGDLKMYQLKLEFGATLFCPLDDAAVKPYTQMKAQVDNGEVA